MSATILGVTGMTEQPLRYGWSPTGGPFTLRTWRGAKDYVPSLTAQLRSAELEYDVEEGPVATVTAKISKDQDGSEEQPTNVWEVTNNGIEKSLYAFNKVQALGTTKVKALRDAVEGTSESDPWDPSELDPTGDQAAAYAHFFLGTDSIEIEQSVIRHTRIVSQNYARSVAQANIGKIFTPAQMALIGAPSAVLLTAETPPNTTAYGFTTLFGYKKKKPEMFQQAGGKWQMVTLYVEGSWSMWIHEAAVVS